MTRANLNIVLSNGKKRIAVMDGSAYPDYFIPEFLHPLLKLNDPQKELEFIKERCTMNEKVKWFLYL